MNLDDFVTVVLTDVGANILNFDNEEFNKTFKKGLKTDYKTGDVYENILWVTLSHFSDCFQNNDHPPFTDLQKSATK